MKMGADMGKLYMYWGGLVTLQMQKFPTILRANRVNFLNTGKYALVVRKERRCAKWQP